MDNVIRRLENAAQNYLEVVDQHWETIAELASGFVTTCPDCGQPPGSLDRLCFADSVRAVLECHLATEEVLRQAYAAMVSYLPAGTQQ